MLSRIKIVDNTAFVKINRLHKITLEGIRRGFLEVGPIINRTMIDRIFNPNKTGRVYTINGQLHQASAPGESPALLTGNLADSVAYEVSGPYQLTVGVTEQAPYAKWLEGFVVNRIKPRPFILPSVLSNEREIIQSVEKGIQRQWNKK